jgi:microcystin degradation protein MlrC
MKIVVGGIVQETNTFSPILTKIQDFKDIFILYGKEVIEDLADKNIEYAGIIKASKDFGFKIIPAIACNAWPSGKLEKGTYIKLRDELIKRVDDVKDYDAVILVLHGSMAAEGFDDTEGNLLKMLREVVKEKPIITTLDLHANVTKEMVTNSDVILGYLTYPHTDLFDTGYRAAKITIKIVKEKIKPKMVMAKLPLFLPPQTTSTKEEPMVKAVSKAKNYLKDYNFLSYFLFTAQPWLDVHDLGSGLLVVTDKNFEKAKDSCLDVAEILWKHRHDFDVKLTPINDAIEEAKNTNGLVVLSDAADSTSSGAPGDNVNILQALLDKEFNELSMLTVVDPEAVNLAVKAGINNKVNLNLGGKMDKIFSKPVNVKAVVKSIYDGKFKLESKTYFGIKMNMGKTVILKVNNIYIIVTEKRVIGYDPKVYRYVGLEPKNAKIDIAKKMIDVDNKGLASSNFSILPYKNVKRPFYPLDYDAKFKVQMIS